MVAGNRVEAGILFTGSEGNSCASRESRTGDEILIDEFALAILFPIDVETEVVHFHAGLPFQQNAVIKTCRCEGLKGYLRRVNHLNAGSKLRSVFIERFSGGGGDE